MQEIMIYVRAAGTGGVLTDEYNNTGAAEGTAVLETQADIVLKLFHSTGTDSAYTYGELKNYTKWCFYADSDFDRQTPVKLAVEDGITVENTGNGDTGVAQIRIPLKCDTEEIAAYIGTSQSKSIRGELQGWQGAGDYPEFVLQFQFSVLNRVFTEGSLEPVSPGTLYYTKVQADQVFQAKLPVVPESTESKFLKESGVFEAIDAEVTKAKVDAAVGASEEGSSLLFYNQRGEWAAGGGGSGGVSRDVHINDVRMFTVTYETADITNLIKYRVTVPEDEFELEHDLALQIPGTSSVYGDRKRWVKICTAGDTRVYGDKVIINGEDAVCLDTENNTITVGCNTLPISGVPSCITSGDSRICGDLGVYSRNGYKCTAAGLTDIDGQTLAQTDENVWSYPKAGVIITMEFLEDESKWKFSYHGFDTFVGGSATDETVTVNDETSELNGAEFAKDWCKTATLVTEEAMASILARLDALEAQQ